MGNSLDDVRQQRVRRIPYRVGIVMHPRDGNERVKGEVRNLSMGGMFIKTILPLKPETVFDVEIPMQPLAFRGSVKVLWTRLVDQGNERPYGMAVEWFNLTQVQKRLVYRQIENHARGGGNLLVGTPNAERQIRQTDKTPVASNAAAPDHTRLFVGLAVAAVVVIVVLILL
jgi:hypothetical protein